MPSFGDCMAAALFVLFYLVIQTWEATGSGEGRSRCLQVACASSNKVTFSDVTRCLTGRTPAFSYPAPVKMEHLKSSYIICWPHRWFSRLVRFLFDTVTAHLHYDWTASAAVITSTTHPFLFPQLHQNHLFFSVLLCSKLCTLNV